MPDKTGQIPASEAETSPAPRDLRAELTADLKSRFNANLLADGTLPKAVCDSLVALLSASDPISADVTAALGLKDLTQPEVPNG
jgi:hypothetical protein